MPPLQSLNLKHFMIAHLLAQGKSQAEAARRLAISPATIQNCLETPEFLTSLEELKQEYAEKLTERVILPFSEMQKKFDEEALNSLNTVVGIRDMGGKEDAVRLKASLALLDRSSNTPKASIANPPDATKDLFSVSVVQLVLETAAQVGDKSIQRAAERALASADRQIGHNEEGEEALDVEFSSQEPSIPQSSPFKVKSLEELLQSSFNEENFEW